MVQTQCSDSSRALLIQYKQQARQDRELKLSYFGKPSWQASAAEYAIDIFSAYDIIFKRINSNNKTASITVLKSAFLDNL